MIEFIGKVIPMGLLDDEIYQCQYPWPDDCAVQCGGNGIVVDGNSMEDAFDDPVTAVGQVLDVVEPPAGSYRTAFFEAFPRNPNTFLRGEGNTVAAAETAAWKKYQRHAACDHPTFEKRGYTNGAGFCVACGMFSSRHYAPWEKCPHCDYPVYPDSVCHHCYLFFETDDDSGDGMLARFRRESRDAARWLVDQGIRCADCGMRIRDMRFISSMDHRLTEEERMRQDRLYAAFVEQSMKGQKLFHKHEKKVTFPASIFYECGCDQFKLIVDLVECETAVSH